MGNLENIKAALALIINPENWTQATMARDAEGNPVEACSPNATCWCAVGAIAKVSGEFRDYVSIRHLNRVARKYYDTSDVTVVNDNMSHEDVVSVFTQVISELENQT